MGNGEDRRGRGRPRNYPKVISVAVSDATHAALARAAEKEEGSIGASARKMLDDSLILNQGRQLSGMLPGWL